MNKYSKIFLSFILIGALTIYVARDVFFLGQQLINKKQQTQNLAQQVNLLFYQQELLEDDAAEYSELQQVIREWQGKLIKSADIDKLLREIRKIGRLNHLQIELFDVSTPEKIEQYNKIAVNISTLGDYNQATHFIDAVADMPWLVAIGNLAFSNSAQNNQLEGEISLDVYTFH